MVLAVPKLSLIRSHRTQRYVYPMSVTGGSSDIPPGSVDSTEEDVWSPLLKIAFETSKVNSKYVHLRFCHTNRYWAQNGERSGSFNWVVATSLQPEEDTSKWSCTLFEPILSHDRSYFFLRHVHTGNQVQPNDLFRRLMVSHISTSDPTSDLFRFDFVDWETLVKLPKHVAFKGYNDKYLKSAMLQGREHLEFSSDDPNEEDSGYEITTNKDGHIRIYSKFFGKFLRRTVSNWIWADSTDTDGRDNNTLFWPVKVNENTIALRSAGNSRFCKAHAAEGISATAVTISGVARFKVEELVLDRFIFRVRYHMDDAHIFDESAFLAGSGTAVNNTDHENAFIINISYEDSSSYSFGNNVSLSSGVSSTFSVGFPRIGLGRSITISEVRTEGIDWNTTTTETKKVVAEYTALVPPKSIVKVDYVGTQATCNIPFTYSQRDKSSRDGNYETTEQVDGVYTGVNYFDFHFEQPKVYPV